MCQVPAQHTGTIQGSGTSGYRVNIENASRDFTGVMESSGTVQPALTAIFRLMDILVDPPPPPLRLGVAFILCKRQITPSALEGCEP